MVPGVLLMKLLAQLAGKLIAYTVKSAGLAVPDLEHERTA